MTITYTAEVATSSFSCFLKLLARWRGSIYKLLWRDFAVFAGLYFLLSFLYRFALNTYQRRVFEMLARYCESNNALIPVAFILGFYVTLIMTRYWNCLGHIPWPDHMAMFVTANVQGLDERSRIMRRTMMRYLCLSFTMTMAAISPMVKKRFPTFKHMVEAGLLTENEQKSLEQIDTPHNTFFIPLAWTTRLVCLARKERRIIDEYAVKTLIDEINQFRMHLATLFVYDWITVPLVYTQVVTVAVYMFFLACLMGRQFLKDDPEVPDLFFPLFTFLEYFFYMGWLKVAECLVNPFGEDEEDFDVNFLIDRNLQVAYIIVDELYNEPPDLVRDQYWDETHFEMPYTAEAEQFRKQPHLGSTMDISDPHTQKIDFSAPGREEMDTIREAESIEEMETDYGVGSVQPSHSLFQSPIAVGIRRLFSRQDSRSHGRIGIHIPTTPVKERRLSSEAQSPATPSHLQGEDLQFNMEYDNPDADDNYLIEKMEHKTSTDTIPLHRIKRTASPSDSQQPGQIMMSSITEQKEPQPSRMSASTSTSNLVTSETSSLKPNEENNMVEPPDSTGVSPIPHEATDTEREMIDFTTETVQPEIPFSAEPSSPVSPDPLSSLWVLASSQLNLTTPGNSDKTSKQ